MWAQTWLGTVLNQGFQDRAALDHYNRAIALAEAHGDRRTLSLARTMRCACDIFQQLGGDPSNHSARRPQELAASEMHTSRSRRSKCSACTTSTAGSLRKSRTHLLRAREVAARSGLRRLQACNECWLAALDEVEEVPADLASRHRRTVEAFRAVGDSRTEALALLELSAQTAHEGDVARAYEQLKQGERLGQRFGDAAIGVLAELQRARIELAESHQARRCGDLARATQLGGQAEARALSAARRISASDADKQTTVVQCSPESRWALRRFEHERSFLGPTILRVSSDGSGFQIDRDDPVALPDGPIIRQALLALAERHLEDSTSEFTIGDFMKRCWPGQRVSAEVSSQRVRQVVTRLRKVGLKPWLHHNRTGYLLDAGLAVRFVPPASLFGESTHVAAGS